MLREFRPFERLDFSLVAKSLQLPDSGNLCIHSLTQLRNTVFQVYGNEVELNTREIVDNYSNLEIRDGISAPKLG